MIASAFDRSRVNFRGQRDFQEIPDLDLTTEDPAKAEQLMHLLASAMKLIARDR